MSDEPDDFDAMAQLCIDACKAVRDNGTPEMYELAKALLVIVGREIAKRSLEDDSKD